MKDKYRSVSKDKKGISRDPLRFGRNEKTIPTSHKQDKYSTPKNRKTNTESYTEPKKIHLDTQGQPFSRFHSQRSNQAQREPGLGSNKLIKKSPIKRIISVELSTPTTDLINRSRQIVYQSPPRPADITNAFVRVNDRNEDPRVEQPEDKRGIRNPSTKAKDEYGD